MPGDQTNETTKVESGGGIFGVDFTDSQARVFESVHERVTLGATSVTPDSSKRYPLPRPTIVPLKKFVVPFLGLLLFVMFVLDLKVVPFFNAHTFGLTVAHGTKYITQNFSKIKLPTNHLVALPLNTASALKDKIESARFDWSLGSMPKKGLSTDTVVVALSSIDRFDKIILSSYVRAIDKLFAPLAKDAKQKSTAVAMVAKSLPSRLAQLRTGAELAVDHGGKWAGVYGQKAGVAVEANANRLTKGANLSGRQFLTRTKDGALVATKALIGKLSDLALNTSVIYQNTRGWSERLANTIDDKTTVTSLKVIKSAKVAEARLSSARGNLQASVITGLEEISDALVEYQNNIILAIYGGVRDVFMSIGESNNKLVLGVWSGFSDVTISFGSIASNLWSGSIGFLADLSNSAVVSWKNFLGVNTSSYQLAGSTDTETLKDQIKQELYTELQQSLGQSGTGTRPIASAPGGMVVLPSTGSSTLDAIKKEQIRQSFSDDVSISFDRKNQSGVIRPVFKNSMGGSYMFVLTPLSN